jgi:histone deacetylase 6
MGKRLDSLYLHRLTLYCARLSAGGAIEAARAVVLGHVKNAFAIIRPPGHHAEHNDPGGFCFFDNVAVAAKVCQKDYGEKCRKILILDWDVHHGNGVQQAFEDNPNVLYISLHVYADGNFYPSKKYGDYLHVGIGEGVGKNINIPWPSQGMKDGDYMYAFQKIVMPCAMEFDPDLVIISAGFDAAEGDLLGGCHVSPGGFAHMTSQLMTLAGGKVVACLEGGYNLKSIARSALAVVRTMMGEAPERLKDTEVSSAGVETVRLVERIHSQYWNCLFPKDKAKSRLHNMGGKRLSDVLRSWQSSEWFDKFQMAEVPIHRSRISQSFKHQVLAT